MNISGSHANIWLACSIDALIPAIQDFDLKAFPGAAKLPTNKQIACAADTLLRAARYLRFMAGVA